MKTEPADLAEEASDVPTSDLPTPEGDATDIDLEDREMKYREMVFEAGAAAADEFDTRVRLWRYNLMLAESRSGDHVTMEEVVLSRDITKEEQLQQSAGQALQVYRSHASYHFLANSFAVQP